MKEQPYLSIVYCGRNDNYGGDFNRRLELSVNWLSGLLEKYALPSELIIVNYNPILDKPTLKDVIRWPVNRKYLSIRIIDVPKEIHENYVDDSVRKTLPLFEFIAKNIGIRRAKGEYILCTNADVIFSEKLVSFIAQKELSLGKLYRSDRLDFKRAGEEIDVSKIDYERFERNIRNQVFEFYTRGGVTRMESPKSIPLRLMMVKSRIFLEKNKFRLFDWWNTKLKLEQYLKKDIFVYDYHCSASGDMALMHRNHWSEIKGYLEDTWISTHTDTLQVIMTAAFGLQVHDLPYPVYHQHHERRFDFGEVNPDMDRMYQRLLRDGKEILENPKPYTNSSDNWGMPTTELEEITF